MLKFSAKDGHESLVYGKPTQQINEHAADLYCGHEEVRAASAAEKTSGGWSTQCWVLGLLICLALIKVVVFRMHDSTGEVAIA